MIRPATMITGAIIHRGSSHLDRVPTLGAAASKKWMGHNQPNLLSIRHLSQNLRRGKRMNVGLGLRVDRMHRG
jgi:hypothetical protein